MDLATLRQFEAVVKAQIPGFRLAFKDEVPWMKALNLLVTPFNPDFMEKYATTIGNTVYMPSRAFYENHPKSSFAILAHEYVHMYDSRKNPLWYTVSYLLPQGLAPLSFLFYAFHGGVWALLVLLLGLLVGCFAGRKSPAFFVVIMAVALIAAAVLALTGTGLWSILFFLGLGLLAPLPSPWRAESEMRAYGMNIGILAWTVGATTNLILSRFERYFTGPQYYFMSWAKNPVLEGIQSYYVDSARGMLQHYEPYGVVYRFLEGRNLVRKPNG